MTDMDKPIENPDSDDFPPDYFFHDDHKPEHAAPSEDELSGAAAGNAQSTTPSSHFPGISDEEPFINPAGKLGLFGDRIFNAVEKNEPKVGSLLVSSPDMRDETFSRSVIYLVQHDSRGTTGVILNQQSNIAVHNVLPDWEPFCSKPATFFIEGPVEPQAAVGLARIKPGTTWDDPKKGQHIEGRTYLVNLDANLKETLYTLESFRIYVGYSAWVPGQLDNELERGDWFVTNSLPQDFGTDNKTDLYAQVLHRQEWPINLYASRPIDPKLN